MANINRCPVREWALDKPDKTVISYGKKNISFARLDGWIEHCRSLLAARDLKPGDRVVVVTHQPLNTIVIALACLRDRLVFCPVNPAFPQTQLDRYCDRIGSMLVIDSLLERWETLNVDAQPSESIELDPQAIMDLIATSGTSGTPKAVAHSYSNYWYSAAGSQTVLPLTENDICYLSLPVFHVGGFAIVIRALISGSSVVVCPVKTELNKVLRLNSISHLSLVNTQLYRLLEEEKDLSKLGVRHILIGGGIASPTLVRNVQTMGVQVLSTYGMTEMTSQVCTGEPQFTDDGITSGKVLPHRDVVLNEHNEILVKGNTLARGYFSNGCLQSITDAQGWFHTGDIGRWQHDQLQVVGRMDNMFVSGGENIHPEEVEQALLTFPEIIQAVVVSKADNEFGYRPVAYVQTTNGQLDETFTKKRLTGKIARFKIPDRILIFPEGVVSSGIKVNRHFFNSLETE